MKRIGCSVYLLILLMACSHAPSENKEVAEEANKDRVDTVGTAVSTEAGGLHRVDKEGLLGLNFEVTDYGFEGRGWYKRLEGTIGGLPVTVHLVKKGVINHSFDTIPTEMIRGYYFYDKYQEPIELYQYHPDPDQEDLQEQLVLYENFTDAQEDQWRLTYNADGPGFYEGTWHGGANGKKLDIYLEEKFPNGSEELDGYWLADSQRSQLSDNTESVALANMNMLMPDIYGDGVYADLAYGIIWRIIPAFADADLAERAGSAEEVMWGVREQFFGAHQEELEMLAASPDLIESSFMDRQMSVVWNDDLHLCLAIEQYESVNGARRSPQTRFLNINLQDWYGIFLDDILEDGYERPLEEAIRREARKIFETDPNGDAAEADKAGITENYAITNKGIWFSFEPNHFSMYGPEEVKIFVAFEKIKAYVKSYWIGLSEK